MIRQEVENFTDRGVSVYDVAHANDPVGRRPICMLVSAQKAPVAVRPRHVEDRARSIEYVRADVTLLFAGHRASVPSRTRVMLG